MHFLLYLLGLPFHAIGSVFHFLLTCFSFVIALAIGIIALPVMLVVGIVKGAFGALLGVVLFVGSPLGFGVHSEPVNSPQIAYQSAQADASFYVEPASIQPVSNYTPTTFTSAPALSHDPIRSSYSGDGCECPYDINKRGNLCGLTSSYSRPGGREPLCYKDD